MIGNIENPKLYNKVHSHDEEFFNKTMLLVFNHLMCNSPKWSDTCLTVWDHPFITYAKFSEKLTFLTL